MTLYHHYGLGRFFPSAHKNEALPRIKGSFYEVKEGVENYSKTKF